MAEVQTLILTKNGDFDGSSSISLTRDNFTAVGSRVHTAAVPGPGGLVAPDFFGFFGPGTPKLVGVAASSNNPRGWLRVISSTGGVREQVRLTTRFQYVYVGGGDKVALLTNDSTPNQVRTVDVTLAVNEVNEAQHIEWAATHGLENHLHARFRIIRTQGNFALAPANDWMPAFQWNPDPCILEVTDNQGDGAISIGALAPFPRPFGALVSVRFANIANDGRVYFVEKITRAAWEAQNALESGRWSRVLYLSHDDYLGIRASAPPVGGTIVCDIEIVPVEPGDRLSGRYAHPEVFTPALGLGNNL